MAHSMLAFAAMLILMRAWGIGWAGSGLSALSYTFGAPILFQYCNIIYLVGMRGFLSACTPSTAGSG